MALYATQNSLSSEPCREEIAYALRRALDGRGETFPLIGIFPQPLDPVLVPGVLATRLYVSLKDPYWAERVAAGLQRAPIGAPAPQPADFVVARHDNQDKGAPFIFEIRPRAGRWYPAKLLVPSVEIERLRWVVVGPSGAVPMASMTASGNVHGGGYSGKQIDHAIDAVTSMFAGFSELPSRIAFGPKGGKLWEMQL